MSPKKATYLCRSKVRYSSEQHVKDALYAMERVKVNPGALVHFQCQSCDGWHLGTRIRGLERPWSKVTKKAKRIRSRAKQQSLKDSD